jgi:antitoxin ParD1/3/4
MTKFSITMPDEMGKYVDSAMKERQFENTSEYFRHLVRQDQDREINIAELRNMLDKAEASGASKRKIPEIMRDVEKRLRKNGRL